ncbi:MAG: His/Gly/Thr/Pro-type tRNA ligase C-terminal domain-containing protein [Myxococcota bacterium]
MVGERERDAGTINVRSRDQGELGEMSVADFLGSIEAERQPGTGIAG